MGAKKSNRDFKLNFQFPSKNKMGFTLNSLNTITYYSAIQKWAMKIRFSMRKITQEKFKGD